MLRPILAHQCGSSSPEPLLLGGLLLGRDEVADVQLINLGSHNEVVLCDASSGVSVHLNGDVVPALHMQVRVVVLLLREGRDALEDGEGVHEGLRLDLPPQPRHRLRIRPWHNLPVPKLLQVHQVLSLVEQLLALLLCAVAVVESEELASGGMLGEANDVLGVSVAQARLIEPGLNLRCCCVARPPVAGSVIDSSTPLMPCVADDGPACCCLGRVCGRHVEGSTTGTASGNRFGAHHQLRLRNRRELRPIRCTQARGKLQGEWRASLCCAHHALY
mmetsp:Transcript_6200/g.12621  ORF Transcript_6200/g.12621 Transcript_6200/m.12621 type:complete len:275 (-) Transcript_6200:77-901(-)